MNLLPEWKWLVRKAWSVRLMLIAALLSGVEVALPFFADSLPRGVFAAMSFVVVSAAFVARLTAQPKMERRSKPRARPDVAKADFND